MLTARVEELKKKVLATTPAMDLENSGLLTEGFKESEGMPLPIQKAHAFQKQCREKTIAIQDGELIVGNAGSKMRGGLLSADNSWSILDNELDTINDRRYDPFYLSDKDRKLFIEKVKPYWTGRSAFEKWRAQAPEEVNVLRDNGAIYIDRKSVRGFGETTAGYEWILTAGFPGVKAYIEEQRAKLDITIPGDYEKDVTLQSMAMVTQGIMDMASRYSELASLMAENEKDAKRKSELKRIAENCINATKRAPETFWEAMQTFYLYHISLLMEQNAAAYNPGRMDQYMYPYYKSDIEKGNISDDEARELLQCLWVKFSEPCLFQDAMSAEYSAGYNMFQILCVGGVDRNGNDAVNDLSYLILDTTADVQLYQPSLVVRYNMSKNPDKFLRRVAELIGMGTGFPAFHNDDVGLKMTLNKGVPLSDAWDWSPGGCVEPNLGGKMHQSYTAFADINLATCVELALTNGVCRKSGKFIGVETGDPLKFKTYEEFEEAVQKQFKYINRAVIMGNHILDDITLERVCPVLSISFKEAIEQAKDYSAGGGKYTNGSGITMVGTADIINSLAAIRYLVYEEKSVGMEKLLEALDADFEGYEDVQKLCDEAPKYGNDDSRVDDIAASIFTFVCDDIESYSNKFGRMTAGILPVSGNTPFGLEIGALPSGRKAWTPLADGISPSGGTDTHGPTAVLKSVSHMPHSHFSAGTLLNMKLDPEMFSSDFGVAQMMALLKSICTLDIYHTQFNVVDQEKLIDAQKNPDEYRGLLVRVAGYTAYFTELGKEVQDEIIARTVQRNVAG